VNRPVVLYHVDFEFPPHVLGLAPVFGEGPLPRGAPTRLRFGEPRIAELPGPGAGQALALGPPGDGYHQLAFALAGNLGNGGPDEQYPTYHIDLTVVVEEVAGSGFTILFDGPMADQIAFTPQGSIIATAVGDPPNDDFGYAVEVGSFQVGVPVRLTVGLDEVSDQWNIALDGESVFSGPNRNPCPAFLEGQCMRNLRLNAAGSTRALVDDVLVMDRPLPVTIDIKPGSDPNSINPSSGGVIPVAILGSDEIDVADVDLTTLAFGPGGAALAHAPRWHLEDVNSDGVTDLVSHYATNETGIAPGDVKACLTGATTDRIPFDSCDSIRTVP
jgi:hypothetical protein